jgi:hypothetical protein
MSSVEENRVVQWMLGISATIAAAGIVGGVLMYAQVQVALEQIKFMRADLQRIATSYERINIADQDHAVRLAMLEMLLLERPKESTK